MWKVGTKISPPNVNDANLDRISQIMAQISLTWCEPVLMGSNAIGSKQIVLMPQLRMQGVWHCLYIS